MKVVIAEKPSVARDLASFLNASARHDGFFAGNDYQITWAFGHLVELQEPHDYDPALRKWSLQTLPFIPDAFELKLRGDEGARNQFAIIKRLFQSADSIICATDAGREGELIFRYILELTGCARKPVHRLWLSSLTPDAIREALSTMRPLADYNNLYAAAKCRSEADWIVGLNATRNYTVRFGTAGILWSIGRVQTPVLAMITRRDDEIRTFKPQPFWELITNYRGTDFRYTGDRFNQQDAAQRLLKTIKPHPLVIKQVQRKPESSLPPQLFDLTQLQREINRRYGISAADTLASAQSLYESKLVTYPRTDSRYLTSDMQSEVPKTLKKLAEIKPREIAKLDLNTLAFGARIVSNQKVTDHHAIIPTGALPTGLRDRDMKVYEAILVRFIAAFYPACVKEATTVDAMVQKVEFRARGVRIVSAGWTQLYPRRAEDQDGDDQQSLPEFKMGESGIHDPRVKSGQTSPPKHFTENTLLGAMDTAGKLVEEAELRDALREKGLGTPATRAAIIETLLRRKYISRDNKNIVATDLGRYLIALVRDHNLKSPELTGEWESKLKQVEAGKVSATAFMDEIADYTRQLIRSSENTSVDSERIGDCPLCGQPVMMGKKALGCSAWRDGCSFVLQPVHRDRELQPRQIRELMQHGVTSEPIDFGDGRRSLLGISPSGAVLEIPLPMGNEQSGDSDRSVSQTKSTAKSGSAAKSKRSTTTNARSRSASKTSANKTSASKASAKKASATRKSPATRKTSASRDVRPSSSSRAKADSLPPDLGGCPMCDAPVIEQSTSFSCSRFAKGCTLTIPKSISGKSVTPNMVKTLLRDGETAALQGFKSKSGDSFSAHLRLCNSTVELVIQR